MTNYTEYASYLQTRSWLGKYYRKHYLYPRLNRYVQPKLLDVGCGIGDLLDFYPSAHGVDINPINVEICKSRGLSAEIMQVDTLHFSDGSYNTIILDNVLEHIYEPDYLLTEAKRVLHDEGKIIIGVPGIKGYASDPDHKRYYDDVSLTKLLETNGFKLEKMLCLPLGSSVLLSKILRQYCIYGIFSKKI